MTLARTPYARLSPADIGQVDRELKKLEQMSAGLFVPKVLVAARSPYTVQATDTMLLCDCTAGPITLTFPLAARVDGMSVQVVKSDSSANAVTLSGTFSGVVNPTISVPDSGFTVFAMNGAYHVTAFVPYPIVTGESGVVSFVYPYGDVRRYGATGAAGTDARAAFAAADAAAIAGYGGNKAVRVPAGTHRLASNITIASTVRFEGGVVKPDAAVTGTFIGALLAGLYQCFDVSNAGAAVVIAQTAVPEVFPQWWGAPVNGVSDDCAAVVAAVASTHPKVRLTAGSWFFADGTGVTVRAAQQIVGDGAGVVAVSVKNSYAFQAPTTGSLDRVCLSGFWVTHRSGSTSGGAVKARSDSFHSGWRIDRVYATGQTTTADPMFYLDGFIGSGIRECFVQQAQIGIKVSSDGFASNASFVVDCNVQTCTVKAIWLSGAGLVVISRGIVESNTGYPIVVDGSASAQVDSVWFEDNSHGLMVMGTANQTKIRGCRFHFHHAGSTDPHIILTGPGGGTDLLGVQIYQNEFPDASGSGTDVTIDANTGGTQFGMNRWHNTTTPVTDLGSGTVYFQNDVQTGMNPAPNRVSGYWEAAYDPFFNTQRDTIPVRKRSGQNTELLAIYDTDGVTFLAHVDRNGMGVFNANSVAIKTKAAAVPNDGDITAGSLRGGILMLDDNGASSRLYVRCGDGVWRSVAIT